MYSKGNFKIIRIDSSIISFPKKGRATAKKERKLDHKPLCFYSQAWIANCPTQCVQRLAHKLHNPLHLKPEIKIKRESFLKKILKIKFTIDGIFVKKNQSY